MALDDWTNCPSCKFPALYKHFVKHVTANLPCPMCDQPIDPKNVVKEINPVPLLKKEIESVDINTLQPSDASQEKEASSQTDAPKPAAESSVPAT